MQELRVLMDLAEAYRENGQQRKACEIFAQAAAALTSLGRDDTQTAGTLYNNWGVALELQGRSLEAEPIYRRAIEISRDSEGEQAVSPMLLANYAGTLASLNRLDEAGDYAERAYAKAVATGNEVVVNMSLLRRETVYRKRGDLDRAVEMLKEVEPRLRRALPPGHIAFAAVEASKSLINLARGDATTALEHANLTIAMIESSIKARGAGVNNLSSQLVHRSQVEMQLGRHQEAADDARRAVDLLRKAAEPGTFSSIQGRAYLALGRALGSQGQGDEARQALESALENLKAAIGPDHSDTRSAMQLLETAVRPH